MMKANKDYYFKELTEFLAKEENTNKCLIVKDLKNNCNAVMHVFFENFSKDYLSGDPVLFYNDGETHTAESTDLFMLLKIVTF